MQLPKYLISILNQATLITSLKFSLMFALHISRQKMGFFPLLLVMFLHFLIPSSPKTEHNIATDQAALLQLKAHITSDPYNFFAYNWSTSESPCNWVGVTCSTRHRRVADLNLPDMSFGGAIPPHVGNLSYLVSLNLSGNNFQGDLPKELWQLWRLRIIDLAHNSLSGSLPNDICKTNLLEVIRLRSNDISGQLPSSLGNCSKLSMLSLTDNKFTGRITPSIGNLTQLEELYLDNNSFEGEMPTEIGNLFNLIFLDINFNDLTGQIPSMIFNISSMQVIDLTKNQFTGHLPSSIGVYLLNLQGLYLAENLLSGTIPSSICNASKLVELELSRNLFSGLIPNTLGNCEQLQLLNLVVNNLTTGSSAVGWSFLSSLTNCRRLTQLTIGDNPLMGVLPTSIGNLSTSLEIFYARASKLSGGIPVEIGNLRNLIFLSLGENYLTGSIPTTLGKLQKLQSLEIYGNKLQGYIPFNLCRLQSLSYLLLHRNELQGGIPACLATLTSLRYLYLHSNKLNSTIPSTLWSLRFILEVFLSSNSLTGSLPFDIGDLKVIIILDLAENQLSGNIPSSIGNLKDLTSLSLARNAFHGPIPQSFGGLTSLETLDLSNNNLSGEIPKSLEALSYLKYFNVSFNGLEGEIPVRGPFVNFSAQSFLSNHALCGSPRLKIPPCKTRSSQRSKMTNTLKYILPIFVSIIIVVVLVIIFMGYCKRHKSQPAQDTLLDLSTWRRISYHELRQSTDGFNERNLLGIGSFGSVYKGTLSDGMDVAIKVFNLQQDGAFKSFNAECEVMRHIRHRNLVKIISSCSNTGFKAIILQYMSKGSLEKWLYSRDFFLDILQRLDIMIDVASALEYLHHNYLVPVIHCDLKPSNILLDDDMVAHVTDFGIAKLLDGVDSVKHTLTLATIGYMAPEYGSEGIVSTNGDVYSFGILLMETFTRKKPIDEMFAGEMSLKHWVEDSLPHAVTEVLDASLLSREEYHYATKKECISSVMVLALKCSVEIPEERMNMKSIIVTLKKIKTKFLKDVGDT